MVTVSVLIPVYAASAFVSETIESLRAQSFRGWEAFLVDDGSPDDSVEVLRRHAERDSRLHVLEQANRGTQAARNLGLARSRAEWVALLDHDDLWLPNKLERQLELAASDPSADLIFSNYTRWDGAHDLAPAWDPGGPPPDGDDLAQQVRHCQFGALTVLIRRAALEAVGGFDPRFLRCGDWDLWLRLIERGVHTVGTSEVLARWRVWDRNLSRDLVAMREEELEVLAAAYDRADDPRRRRIYHDALATRRGNLLLRRALATGAPSPPVLRRALLDAWRERPGRLRLLSFALGLNLPAVLGGRRVHERAVAKIERSF